MIKYFKDRAIMNEVVRTFNREHWFGNAVFAAAETLIAVTVTIVIVKFISEIDKKNKANTNNEEVSTNNDEP